jgi:hydrogenase expression/formation protein HypC
MGGIPEDPDEIATLEPLSWMGYTKAMCLAVPARITKIEGAMAEAEIGGITRRVSVVFTPDVKVGDYVVMHAGYAINILDQQEAEATFRLLEAVMGNDADA